MSTQRWMRVLLAASWTAVACAVDETEDGPWTTAGGGSTNSDVSVGDHCGVFFNCWPCDTGVRGDIDTPVCDACITCSRTADCMADTQACSNNPDCVDYETCRGGCFDTCDTNMNNTIDMGVENDCYTGTMRSWGCHGDLDLYRNDMTYVPPAGSCIELYGSGNMTGVNDYWDMLGCWICLACANNCSAATNCY